SAVAEANRRHWSVCQRIEERLAGTGRTQDLDLGLNLIGSLRICWSVQRRAGRGHREWVAAITAEDTVQLPGAKYRGGKASFVRPPLAAAKWQFRGPRGMEVVRPDVIGDRAGRPQRRRSVEGKRAGHLVSVCEGPG